MSTMNENSTKRIGKTWARITIGALVAALLVVAVWFALDVHALYKKGAIAPAFSRIRRRPLGRPAMAAGQIQGWMTFRYVESVFHLQPGYLAAQLKVQNLSNPNMTLDGYARSNGLDSGDFVESVARAVAGYQGGPRP